MFERKRSLLGPAETIREEIAVAHVSRFDRFDSWLKEQLPTPRFCSTHATTRLRHDRGGGGVFKIFEDYRDGFSQEKEKPGVFSFRLDLKCPACQCAYALCPPEFRTTSLKGFDSSTPERALAIQRCREFVAQVNAHGRGFALFVGTPGTGKTRLACNIVGALHNPDALFVRQAQLTVALRASYGRKDVFLHRPNQACVEDEDDPPTALAIPQDVRFLVLDELACAPLANDERLQLDELLKHRYDQRKPTILISNLALDQLKDFLGDALTDRIKHASGNGKFILQFSGESFRRTTGESYLAG